MRNKRPAKHTTQSLVQAPRLSSEKLVFVAVLLFASACLLLLPHTLRFSHQETLVFLTINVLLVASYRLLTLTGEWSLGHVVMMGAGGYASALLTKRLGIPIPAGMLLGAGVAAAVAWLFSFPLFRLKGFTFLIGSFAASEILRLLWKRFREPFGGAKGIKRIPALEEVEIFGLTIDFFNPVTYYYFALTVVALSLFVMWSIERSTLGLYFHAVKGQSDLARSVGLHVRRTCTQAFVTASFFAGLAGALLAHYIGTVNPNQFSVSHMVFLLTWTIVGGTATFYGPILGVVVLTIINEGLLRELGSGHWRPFFYGGILVLTVLFLPSGLESLVPNIRKNLSRRRVPRLFKRLLSPSAKAKAGCAQPASNLRVLGSDGG